MGNRTSSSSSSALSSATGRANSCKKHERSASNGVDAKRRFSSTATFDTTSGRTVAAFKKQPTFDSGGPATVLLDRKRVVRSIPVEKLVQILTAITEQKQLNSKNHNLIDKNVFQEVLFKYNKEFAGALFDYFKRNATDSKSTDRNSISNGDLRTELEHLIEIKEDRKILETYLNIYTKNNQIETMDFETLLFENYKITKLAKILSEEENVDVTSFLENVSEPSANAVRSVLAGCFHGHENRTIESKVCVEWLMKNCARLLHPLHYFCTFVVSVAYRYVPDNTDVTSVNVSLTDDCLNHFALQVPLLVSASFEDRQYAVLNECLAWILAGSLEKNSFLKLDTFAPKQKKHKTIADNMSSGGGGGGGEGDSTNVLDKKSKTAVFWTLLYNSSEHGLCLNRFMYHVVSYRGPSVTLVSMASGKVFAIATASEWIESNTFAGSSHDYVYQIYPEFLLIEHGQKILYLNGTLIGGVHGLKAGSSVRNSQLIIDADFVKVSFGSVSDRLVAIETWGCGERNVREKQLDSRAWTSTQIERQRVVKLSADDWTQHPDRYLLNMAGRPQYNNEK